MPAALQVDPSRLVGAGARLRPLSTSVALAGGDIRRALDEVDAALAGDSAGQAAEDLSLISARVLRTLVTAVDALAAGLDAAAARYLDADVLRGAP
jgi:hypothetical protein